MQQQFQQRQAYVSAQALLMAGASAVQTITGSPVLIAAPTIAASAPASAPATSVAAPATSVNLSQENRLELPSAVNSTATATAARAVSVASSSSSIFQPPNPISSVASLTQRPPEETSSHSGNHGGKRPKVVVLSGPPGPPANQSNPYRPG